MPSKPNTPCKHPGCPALVSSGKKYCKEHAPSHAADRPSAAKRGYGSRWQKVRKRYLQAHPLCEECLKHGRYVKATDVDHVVAHRGDQRLMWDEGNFRALCHSCHSKKTRQEDMNPEYKY